ncbi:cyclic GMP-AMP synthase [Anolis carolinensis]|uniref:cyclic GMP-AMP synthase n=1 Tax=Anolis carolinensis TaxID=28377 RepID=UPI002F2B7614
MEPGAAVRRKKSGQKKEEAAKGEKGKAAPTERAAGAAKGATEAPKKGRKGTEAQKNQSSGEEKGMERKRSSRAKSEGAKGQEAKEEEAAPRERAAGAARGDAEAPKKGRKGGQGQEEAKGKAAPRERAAGAAKGATEAPKKGRKGGEGQEEEEGGEEKGVAKKRSSRAKKQQAQAGEAAPGAAPQRQEAKEAERCSGARRKSLPRGAAPAAASPALRPVLERLRLGREARSEAADQVNQLRDRLVRAVKKVPGFKTVEVFGAGSYYEGAKICSPNEFDIMLKIPEVRLELESCEVVSSSGAFHYVKLKRDPANKELKEFCEDNERLSSSRMLLGLRNIIMDEVKKMADMNVSVEKKRPGSPAVTILIGSPPSVISVDIILALEFHHPKWCSSTENGLGIEEWMGTKVKKSLRSEPLYLVTKNVKDGKCFIENTWRLSFSNIEKMLLQNHGQTKTCCEIKGEKCCRLVSNHYPQGHIAT